MADDLRYRIGIDGSAAAGVLRGLTGNVGSLGQALIGLGSIGLFTKVVKDGFEFNQTMHDGELAIAAIVQQFHHLDDVAAKKVAAGAMQKIIDLEPKVAGSLADLVQGFSSTAAASAGVGISVDQNIDLVGRFANALGKLSLPINQVGQELRSILTGNIGQDSQLARTLGITNEMVESAKTAGNLYEMLRSKIGQLGEAGDNAATRFSSLKSAIDKAAGALAEGLFSKALNSSVELTATVDANRQAFADLGAGIGLVATEVGKFANFVYELTKSTAALGATIGVMISDGKSYSEAAAVIDQVVEARKRDAAAAAEQAKSAAAAASPHVPVSTLTDEDRQKAGDKQKKRAKAAAKASEGEDSAKAFDDVLDAQERLNELKHRASEEEMSKTEQIAAVRKRLTAAAEHEAAVKSDPFGGSDPRAALEAETKRVELERELAQLIREQAKESKHAAKAAQDKAEHARKEAEAHAQARNTLQGQLAILEDLAAGDEAGAQAKQRQLDIEAEKLRIMHDQQASEEDALALATRKAGLEDAIAKRKARDAKKKDRPDDGRFGAAHIGGVKRRYGLSGNSGPLAGGALDEFDSKAKGGASTFDLLSALSAKPIGGLGISTAGLSASRGPVKPPTATLLGFSSGKSLSDRIAKSTTPGKKDDNAKAKEQDPMLEKLGSIEAELKRIRTA